MYAYARLGKRAYRIHDIIIIRKLTNRSVSRRTKRYNIVIQSAAATRRDKTTSGLYDGRSGEGWRRGSSGARDETGDGVGGQTESIRSF